MRRCETGPRPAFSPPEAAIALADTQAVLAIDGEYRATSSSHPLGSYRLMNNGDGWSCECIANREYGMPCKHLWVLADALGLDILTDIRISPDLDLPETDAA